MGGLVSTLAFPVPDRHRSEPVLKYQGNRLVWLTTRPSTSSASSEEGIRIPALYIQRPKSTFTLLYSHGNAEDLGILLHHLDEMSVALNVDIFAYEYPGYSIAEGEEPSEQGCYDAIDAAYEYLSRNINPYSIVLVGRSLGSGPTVHLASRTPHIAGTILQSPLESGIRCVLGTCSSIALYPLDIFCNYAKVSNIQGPVLIFHGLADRVVPCRNGKALHALLQQRPNHVPYDPVWIPGRGHNDIPHDLCLQLMQEFLEFLASNHVPIAVDKEPIIVSKSTKSAAADPLLAWS